MASYGLLFDEVVAICAAAGFDIAAEYTPPSAMIAGIREVEQLAHDATLTDAQQLALLENLRLIMVRTAPSGELPSVAAQSRLQRWRFLRSVSSSAADAYVALLTLLGLPVPSTLERP